VEIGTADQISRVQLRSTPRFEKMYLPAANCQSAAGFHEIFRWIETNKHVAFYWLKDRLDEDRENMGRCLYRHILSFFDANAT
jgi:hypothetical protein